MTATGGINRLSGDSSGSANASASRDLACAAKVKSWVPLRPGSHLRVCSNANARVTWGKTFDDLVAHADATIDGRTAARSQDSRPKQVSTSGQGTSTGERYKPVHCSY